jgi:hypothetical protein
VIVSRGGANPEAVTIECEGRKYRREDKRLANGERVITGSWSNIDALDFYDDQRKREWERRNRILDQAYARAYDGDAASASPEALAMLGLSPPFTKADVLRAFRAKSLKAHPDQGGEADFMRALVMARDAALADATADSR